MPTLSHSIEAGIITIRRTLADLQLLLIEPGCPQSRIEMLATLDRLLLELARHVKMLTLYRRHYAATHWVADTLLSSLQRQLHNIDPHIQDIKQTAYLLIQFDKRGVETLLVRRLRKQCLWLCGGLERILQTEERLLPVMLDSLMIATARPDNTAGLSIVR